MKKVTVKCNVRTLDLDSIVYDSFEFVQKLGLILDCDYDSLCLACNRNADDIILEMAGDMANAIDPVEWLRKHPGTLESAFLDDSNMSGYAVGDVLYQQIVSDCNVILQNHRAEILTALTAMILKKDFFRTEIPCAMWDSISGWVRSISNGDVYMDNIRAHFGY